MGNDIRLAPPGFVPMRGFSPSIGSVTDGVAPALPSRTRAVIDLFPLSSGNDNDKYYDSAGIMATRCESPRARIPQLDKSIMRKSRFCRALSE
jgi:hypothetical protein